MGETFKNTRRLLASCGSRDWLKPGAIIVTIWPSSMYRTMIERPEDIPFVLSALASTLDPPADSMTVIVCAGRETITTLQHIAEDQRFREVVRVEEGTWWPLSRVHGCPAPGYPLPPADSTSPIMWVAIPVLALDDPQTMSEWLAHRLEFLAQAGIDDTEEPAPLGDTPSDVLLLAHAVAERDARTEIMLDLDTVCAELLLQATGRPDVWAAFLTWTDQGAWRLWLALIHCTPDRRAAPVAALIATVALAHHAPRTASVAALHGLDHDPDPHVSNVLQDVLDLTLDPHELGEYLEEIFGPQQP